MNRFTRLVIALACLAGLMVPASSAVAATPKWVQSFQQEAAKAPDMRGQVPDLEVSSYAKKYGVSAAEATRRLTIQSKAGDVTGKLQTALGDQYAGVYFDNSDGAFVVPTVPSADSSAAVDVFQKAGVASTDVRTERAAHSMKFLENLQNRLDKAKSGRTSISPRSNAVVVTAPAAKKSAVIDLAGADSDSVIFQEGDATASPMACTFPYCTRSLRGAIGIWDGTAASLGYSGTACSAGFVAFKRSDLQPRMLSAGHCHVADVLDTQAALGGSYPGGSGWWSKDSGTGVFQPIGMMENYSYGGTTGDSLAINVTPGGYWYGPPYPFWKIAAWTFNEEYPINSRINPYVGLYGCHVSGYNATNKLGCGTVNGLNNTVTYSPVRAGQPMVTVNGLYSSDACTIGGDSGGPWASNYAAVGITSGSGGTCGTTGYISYFEPILHAESVLGMEVLTQYTVF